jgi:CheY-like chemotaxis protein
LEVESEAGRGTIFRIYLPRAEAPERRTVVAGGGAVAWQTGARVLLVEDDAGVRSLAERVLTRLGYRLRSAASAEEALELLARDLEPIDLLVTDLVMPGMSGRELAETLRTLQPGLKVLFTSGYASDQVMRRGATQPTGNFIEKPFAPEELEQAVRRVLGP